MAAGGNLKKRLARLARRIQEAICEIGNSFGWRSPSLPLITSGDQGKEAPFDARLKAVEAQVRTLRSGWDTLIPEVLDTVSATHHHSVGAASLHGRLDVLREDVDLLSRRVDTGLEALAARVAALESGTPAVAAKSLTSTLRQARQIAK